MKEMTKQEQIKSIRDGIGISQRAFAKAVRIPRRTVEDWESGKSEPPQYVIELLKYYVDHEQESIYRSLEGEYIIIG